MAYHHVTESQQYIQTLDLDPINAERQNLIANSFPADNSFYSGGADEIQLGTGGVDDGEDADVIVHEYGHAVQDAQNPDACPQREPGGRDGRGLRRLPRGRLLDRDVRLRQRVDPCIMEWDATVLRRPTPATRPGHLPAPRRRSRLQARADRRVRRRRRQHPLHRPGLVERPARPARSSWATTAAAARSWTGPAGSHFAAAVERDLRGGGRGAILDADTAIYGGAHCGQLGDRVRRPRVRHLRVPSLEEPTRKRVGPAGSREWIRRALSGSEAIAPAGGLEVLSAGGLVSSHRGRYAPPLNAP